MDIRIIGRHGSKAVTAIVKHTKLGRYKKSCDIVINYGLAGKKLKKFRNLHKSLIQKFIINKVIGHSKYKVIKEVEKIGILVPRTFLSLSNKAKLSEFISKNIFSQGGKGIVRANTRHKKTKAYYQQFIKERRYELRVHGFLWTNQQNWLIQKRLGDSDKIAWNFSQGGRFQTIRNSNYEIFKQAKDITKQILKLKGMAFGAVDFIVTDDNKLYFLEINSAPGFTDLSKNNYFNSFTKLGNLSKKEILRYTN